MSEMKVYMPSGELIFETRNKELFYTQEICRSMRENGYKVTIDGKLYPQLRKKASNE